MSATSRASGSEDEPLVPDDFDDDFYKELLEKVPEITKALRQKDTQDNADNVQRLVICCNRYKSDLQLQKQHSEGLNEEISILQHRFDNAADMSRLDQDTMRELRGVIESAWMQKDMAQSREQAAQDEMVKLREKVEQLEGTVAQLSDKRSGYQSKRDENTERDKLKAEIRDLNKRIQIQRMYTNEVEAMTKTLDEKNKALLKLLEENSSEAYSSKKQLDQLQKDLSQMKSQEVKYTELLTQLKGQNAHLVKMKVRQNLQILSLKTNLEHLNSQYNANCNKLAKITVDLEYAIQERDKNKRDLVQRVNILKLREDEIIKLKQDNAKLGKAQDGVARKYATLNDSKNEAEEENIRLKTQLNTQDKEIESMRRVVHHFEKNNETLTKERDALKRDLMLEHRSAEDTDELLQKSLHELKSLKDTISSQETKHKKLLDDLNKVKKEKSKKTDEIQTCIDKIDALHNDIHLKENYVIELKRTISDLESKCGRFQAQHDALLNEKNNVQRGLQTAEDEKTKLRQQHTALQTTIEALKGKVTFRDGEIGRLQLQIDRMEKERRVLKTEIHSSKLGHQHTRAELLEKKKENDHFSKSLKDDDLKLARLKKDFDNVLNEKNSISAALTKRNEDLAQLKDKQESLQTVYDQTEKQFAQSQDDMRLMRIEIKNLRTERNVLRKDRESAADLRQELLQMHRLLNQERIKARALQEEMMTPMNIHRWRNLSGKDPEKMELINQIKALRRQLLNQNVACFQQERALDETQQLYEALKEFMLKLPSHKVQEELNTAKHKLSAKDKKMKALIAELNTKEADDRSNEIQLEELKTNLAAAKTQLTQEKKRKQKLLEERQILVQMQAQCYSAPPNMRTLGAGFKIPGGF